MNSCGKREGVINKEVKVGLEVVGGEASISEKDRLPISMTDNGNKQFD